MIESELCISEHAPPILFKYRSWRDDNQKKLLLNSEMYFPSPSKFNDPFDSMVPIVPIGTNKDIFQRILEDVNDRFPHKTIQERRSIAKEWFKKKNFKDNELQFNLHKERVEKQYGIYSLCEDNQSLLLWAHYADSHQGYCVGIDWKIIIEQTYWKIDNAFPTPFFIMLGKVEYRKEWPTLEYQIIPQSRENRTDIEITKQLVQPLLCKSVEWAYEKEWRLISLSQTNFTFQIEPHHITSIYLGAKMPEKDRNEVIALKQSMYNHAKLYQARLLTGTFGLGFELIS